MVQRCAQLDERLRLPRSILRYVHRFRPLRPVAHMPFKMPNDRGKELEPVLPLLTCLSCASDNNALAPFKSNSIAAASKKFLVKNHLVHDNEAQHILRGTGCSHASSLGHSAIKVASVSGHASADAILKAYSHSVNPPVPPVQDKVPISLAFQFALLRHEDMAAQEEQKSA